MSKHFVTLARNNCLLTGRNLEREPGSLVGSHLPRLVLRIRIDLKGIVFLHGLSKLFFKKQLLKCFVFVSRKR